MLSTSTVRRAGALATILVCAQLNLAFAQATNNPRPISPIAAPVFDVCAGKDLATLVRHFAPFILSRPSAVAVALKLAEIRGKIGDLLINAPVSARDH